MFETVHAASTWLPVMEEQRQEERGGGTSPTAGKSRKRAPAFLASIIKEGVTGG